MNEAKKKSTFTEVLFKHKDFKYGCKQCESACHCGVRHAPGTPHSHAVICQEKHWFIIQEKEVPQSEYQQVQIGKWRCPTHSKNYQAPGAKFSHTSNSNNSTTPTPTDTNQSTEAMIAEPTTTHSSKRPNHIDPKPPNALEPTSFVVDTKPFNPCDPVLYKKINLPMPAISTSLSTENKFQSTFPFEYSVPKKNAPIINVSTTKANTEMNIKDQSSNISNAKDVTIKDLKQASFGDIVPTDKKTIEQIKRHWETVHKWYNNPKKSKKPYLSDESFLWNKTKMNENGYKTNASTFNHLMDLFEKVLTVKDYNYRKQGKLMKNVTQIWVKKNDEYLKKKITAHDPNEDLFDPKLKLPFSLSMQGLERLRKRNKEGYLNDELMYMFIYLLEQYQIWKSSEPDDDPELKGIVYHILPPTTELKLYPCPTKFPKTSYGQSVCGTLPNNGFSLEYKDWFQTTPKNKLDVLFDDLRISKIGVKGFEFPYNKGGGHWITIRCIFPDEKEYPAGMVTSIDYSTDDDDEETQMIRIQFAKLMGVYCDLLKTGQAYCGIDDMRLNYRVKDAAEYIKLKENHWSSFPHEFANNGSKGKQRDTYNCGVLCCFNSQNFIKGNLQPLKPEETTETKCNMFREAYFSVLSEFLQLTSSKDGKHIEKDQKDSPSQQQILKHFESLESFKTLGTQSTKGTNVGEGKESAKNEDVILEGKEKEKEIVLRMDKEEEGRNNDGATVDIVVDMDKEEDGKNKEEPNVDEVVDMDKEDGQNDGEATDDVQHLSSSRNEGRNTSISSGENGSLSKIAAEKKRKHAPVKEKKNSEVSPTVTKKKLKKKKKVEVNGHFVLNALTLEGVKKPDPIGKSPGLKNPSLLEQLTVILKGRLDLENFDDEEKFRQEEIINLETFFMSDWERPDPPTLTSKDSYDNVGERAITSVAMVEFAEYGNFQYKHKNIVVNNEIKVERTRVGYKTTTQAIIVHYIATQERFEGFGYASRMLKNIADVYKDKTVYVYAIIPEQVLTASMNMDNTENDEQERDYSLQSIKALKYLKKIGFEEDPKNNNFNLSLVDTKNKEEMPITANRNKILRTTSTKLRNISDNIVYNSAKFCKVDKYHVTKLLYAKKIDETKHSLEEVISRVRTMTYEEEDSDGENSATAKTKAVTSRKSKDKEEGEYDEDKKRSSSKDYVFYGWNPHFHWLLYDEEQVETIAKPIIKMCKDEFNTVILIPSGYRNENRTMSDTIEGPDYLPRIQNRFRLSSKNSASMGTCQWMAAAMLIHRRSQECVKRMMDLMKYAPEKVNWKYLFKGQESLSTLLPKVTKFELVKVDGSSGNYISYLMNAQEGMYVAILTDSNYGQGHVVGIDCESAPKLIWDSSETRALMLTYANLDRCVGEYQHCFRIRFIGRIMRKNTCCRQKVSK